jgi:hypothetical protein
MKWVCVAAGLAALLFAAPAYGDGFADWEARLAATPAFYPSLSYRTVPQPAYDTIVVYRCPGGGACEGAALSETAPGRLDASAAVAGDVFEAHWLKDGAVVHTAQTPVWNGPLTVSRTPEIHGDPTTGATLTASAAEGAGGWGAPWGLTLNNWIAVCRTAQATDCNLLSRGDPVALEARWTGWYAFAQTAFFSGHTNAVALRQMAPLSFPTPVSSLGQDGSSSVSAPLGPIAAAPAPGPKPQPIATIRTKALRAKGRLSVGRVTCPIACTVNLTVSGGGKTIRRSLRVTGTQALTIPRRHGRLRVKVVVDGKTLASGFSRAR